jgi:hypothetical protein
MTVTLDRKITPSKVVEQLQREIKLHRVAGQFPIKNIQQIENELFRRWLKNPQFPQLVVTTMDFDKDPNGNLIADGIQLDGPKNPYQSHATFTAIPGQEAPSPLHVWVRADPVDNVSPPNVVTLTAPPAIGIGDSDLFGRIRVSFTTPFTLSVAVQARVLTPWEMLSPGPPPYLKAYDWKDNLIASASFPADQVPQRNCEVSQPVTLSVSAAYISYVEFSCAYDPNCDPLFGIFDTLVYSGF